MLIALPMHPVDIIMDIVKNLYRKLTTVYNKENQNKHYPDFFSMRVHLSKHGFKLYVCSSWENVW